MTDYDNLSEHWLKGIPYVYKSGSSIDTSYRYYILHPSDIVYVQGEKSKYENVKGLVDPSEVNVIITVLDRDPKTCDWVFNYFQVLHPSTLITVELRSQIRIQGRSIEIPSTVKSISGLIRALNTSELGRFKLLHVVGRSPRKKPSPKPPSPPKKKSPKEPSPLKKKSPKSESPKEELPEMTFDIFAEFMEKIKKYSKILDKKKYISKLFQFYSKSKNSNCSYLLQLLLPQNDDRIYALKEFGLAKIYIDALKIPKTSQNAQRILEWKKPTEFQKAEDFADALHTAITHYLPNDVSKKKYTIRDIIHILDELKMHTEGVLNKIIPRMSAREQKWLVRIILKNGLSERVVLDALHPDASALYDTSMDLNYVCEQVSKLGTERFKGDFIRLFSVIKPMLASHKKITRIDFSSCFSVETKYDGERIQIHKQGNKIRLYSRNGNNVTDIYGHALVPKILENVKVDNVILDGEILVWDSEQERYETFGTLKFYAKEAQMKKYAQQKDKEIAYVAFDILYYKDKPIIFLPLQERREYLKKAIPKQIPHVFEISKQHEACSLDAVLEYVDKAIISREEGIMLKDPKSSYYPGSRSKGWIKIKPQYLDGIGDEMDLIIMGGYYGSGNKRGDITHFIMGVFDERTKQYRTFAKVGTGYSKEQLKTLQTELDKRWKTVEISPIPKYMIFGDEKPDVWIEPAFSRVLAVSGHQIVVSSKFSSGFTIRFPTVAKIRYDKDATEILTLQELIDLDKEYGGFAHASQESLATLKDLIKKVKKKKIETLKVLPHRLPADISDIPVSRDILKGKEFMVFSGTDEISKHDIEKIIHRNGGTFIQNPREQTMFIIASTKPYRVQLYQKQGFKIASPNWILDMDKKKKYLEPDKYIL